jgi:RNA polymerase sigma-70 factor (ECF subfamily)
MERSDPMRRREALAADPDRAWVSACQELPEIDRAEAFRVLHQRHEARVRRICLRITGNASDALDATQETFLLAYRGIRSFRFRARLARWLYRIAAHVALGQRRARRAPSGLGALDELVPDHRSRTDPHVSAELRELRARVRRTVRRLSPPLREVLVLRHLRGLSYADIQARLAIPEGSVKSRLHRAQSARVWRASFPAEAAEERERLHAAAGA